MNFSVSKASQFQSEIGILVCYFNVTNQRKLYTDLFLDEKFKLSLKFCSSHKYVHEYLEHFHYLLFSSYVQKPKRLHVETSFFLFFQNFWEQNERKNRSHAFLGMYAKNNCKILATNIKLCWVVASSIILKVMIKIIYIVSFPLSKNFYYSQWNFFCSIA